MDVEVAPTRKVTILGLDKRSVSDIAWCAATYGVNRLYWVNGYLMSRSLREVFCARVEKQGVSDKPNMLRRVPEIREALRS